MVVDFPQPEPPTNATDVPGWIWFCQDWRVELIDARGSQLTVRSIPWRTGTFFRRGYRKCTSWKLIAPSDCGCFPSGASDIRT